MMGAWEEYQTAAQRLDRVRRDAATAVAEHTAAIQGARQELAAVRQRLVLQQARITDLATRAGMPPPILSAHPPVPDPATPAAISDALRAATGELDAADAAVSEVDGASFSRGPFPDWPQLLRNILVYASVALLVLIVQVVLLNNSTSTVGSILALGFAAILPAAGYGVSLLTLGLLYGKVERNPVLGAAISAVPVVLWCLWTFAVRAVTG
jgi:hypothetical protein